MAEVEHVTINRLVHSRNYERGEEVNKMLIQCTKKLLDQLKIKPSLVETEQPLFSWHANLIIVNHRKTIVLVNDNSRYVIVLYGLKAKDFKNLNEIINNSIRDTLLDEYIKPEIVERYINHLPEIIYTKTKDRSMVAKMNKACDQVYFYGAKLNSNSIGQSAINIRVSASLVGDGGGNYSYPHESLYKALEAFANETIFTCKAVGFKVMLDLEEHYAWRKVIVPLNITFKRLHDILQILFDWKDYHLHKFYIFDGEKPVANIVSSDDAFEDPYNLPTKIEIDTKLVEYIPKYSRIKYNYDFGDNWQHYIEIEEINDNYTQNYPVCLAGEGNAPPEDVGGSSGYAEFLKAISDPKHPEHVDMLEWGKMQWYRDFNIELVNKRLVNSLKGLWER